VFPRRAVIIDGPTLAFAFSSPATSAAFFSLGMIAASVVCCRVSPKQKADVVALAKQNGSWVTLAVGDGANDVSMIMEAHIGVGIRGKEGTQAVRTADYAVSQFRFLQRLLLIHGRLGYIRVSKMVCYYFYKNMILVFTEIYFAVYCGYSGQIFFLDWLPMLYNAAWTSWQCLFAFTFEQDCNEEYTLKYPVIYKAGQKGLYFNKKVFVGWFASAIMHGCFCFWVPVLSFTKASGESGMTTDHWLVSTICFSAVVHVVVLKLFIETVYWHWLSIGSGLLSVILYYSTVLLGNIPSISYAF